MLAPDSDIRTLRAKTIAQTINLLKEAAKPQRPEVIAIAMKITRHQERSGLTASLQTLFDHLQISSRSPENLFLLDLLNLIFLLLLRSCALSRKEKWRIYGCTIFPQSMPLQHQKRPKRTELLSRSEGSTTSLVGAFACLPHLITGNFSSN